MTKHIILQSTINFILKKKKIRTVLLAQTPINNDQLVSHIKFKKISKILYITQYNTTNMYYK